MRSFALNAVFVGTLALVAAGPAAAGAIGVPAPAAGVGIGALALLALGYRSLRKQIDR